ncbi:MAG: DUF308 domain-containing protein [Bacilli bacterium]|nr:DUF308 domain-containing protein [Bacilli bacterium]
MNEQAFSKISLGGNFLLFFILGIILIMTPNKSLSFFHLTISIIIIILGVASTILNAFRKKSFQNTIFSILLFIMGIYFLYNPTNFLSIFPLIFALYVVLIGIIKFSTFCVYKSNGFKGFHKILLNALFELLFAYLIITNPTESIKPLTIILGFYFIFISIGYFTDFLEEAFPNNFLTKRRKFRITLPNILSLFIPYAFYRKINNSLNKEVTNVKIDKNTSGEVDLEIFIGVKESTIGKFGHADLCFENKIYSYGHYDEDSKRLFDTIGDGTLFIVNDRDKYLKFCAEHSKKTIFAFGITLTEKQKENVRNELNKIKGNTYRWKCIQENDKEKQYGDYASCLYRATKAKFYKFHRSSYKLYYALWANCVKLVDHILRISGSDILRLNGVITPGAYYHHLNNQFKKKNSNVIRKEIITNSDIITQNKK